jgi:hypothetical protein
VAFRPDQIGPMAATHRGEARPRSRNVISNCETDHLASVSR